MLLTINSSLPRSSWSVQLTEGLFTGRQGPHQGYAADDQHKESGTGAGGGWNSTCVLATKPGILVQG